MSQRPAPVRARLVVCLGFATFVTLQACGGSSAPVSNAPVPTAPVRAAHGVRHLTATPIQHIVVIVQENRSFDNLFNGYPQANTVTSGQAIPVDANGKPIPNATPTTIPLAQTSLRSPWDVVHGLSQFDKSYDQARNDGFSEESTVCYVGPPACTKPSPTTYPAYAFVPQSETGPYWRMASQYVLADNMFESNIDASFVAHQYLIAGWSNHAVNYQQGGSWGCDNASPVPTLTQNRKLGPGESACFGSPDPSSYPTLASELEAAGFDWRYYAPGRGVSGYFWSAFDAIDAVRNGPEWTGRSSQKVISPPAQVIRDAANGNLPVGVTWVTPILQNSDHASSGTAHGPSWVANVVNAIGGNAALWNTTAIFVVWDDWGGWYDHVAPVQLDYDGLGLRVPMLVISPYALQGNVAHTPYEFGSILKFAEDNFGVGRLAPANCCYGGPGSDTRANTLGSDVFNFSQPPRSFVPIQAPLKPEYFLHQTQSDAPIDER
jgi:phospholipase C